jgi:hypothetical protein
MGGRLEGRIGARGVVTGEGEAHIFVVSTARAVWQGHNSVSNLTTHAACCGVNEDSVCTYAPEEDMAILSQPRPSDRGARRYGPCVTGASPLCQRSRGPRNFWVMTDRAVAGVEA